MTKRIIYYALSPLMPPSQFCWLPNPAALAGCDLVCHPDALPAALAAVQRRGYELRRMDEAEERRRAAARHDVIVEV